LNHYTTESRSGADENLRIQTVLREQDPDHVGELIERFSGYVMRYLTYLLRDRHDAEDLSQDVWMKVLRSGATYDGKAPFSNWLATVCRNTAIDHLRRRRTVYFEDLESLRGGDCIAAAGKLRSSPLEEVLQLERADAIEIAMASLPALQETVVRLRFQKDMTLEEITAILQAPLNTTKARLYRVLAAMKEALDLRMLA